MNTVRESGIKSRLKSTEWSILEASVPKAANFKAGQKNQKLPDDKGLTNSDTLG